MIKLSSSIQEAQLNTPPDAPMILRRLLSTSNRRASSFKLPPTIRQLLDVPIADAAQQPVTVSGWIKSIRKQKNVAFAVVTDGSSSRGLQAVFVGGVDGVKGLTNGTAVQLTGKLVPSPGSRQDRELLLDFGKTTEKQVSPDVQILGKCDPEVYPIQKQALSTEYLRDNAHLRARTDSIAAMIRLRDSLKKNISTFFDEQGFCYAHTPVLTGNDAEGAGEAFKLARISTTHPSAHPSSLTSPDTPNPEKQGAEFFSRPAYLTVSHQLHLESLATALSRVYTLSPCFRAEPSLTGRHLSEFWMLEAEWAFSGAREVDDVCRFVENCLRSTIGQLLQGEGYDDMHVLWKNGDYGKRRALEDAVRTSRSWTRLSYTDAIKALATDATSVQFQFKPQWGLQLQSEHERWLAETLVQGPMFITDYPASFKPFYMRGNEDGRTVACFDLIVPHVGELVGGSVREERADVLERKMRAAFGAGQTHEDDGEEEDPLKEYRWYLDLRRFGGAPHAGFGMGFERLVGWAGGIENVRECIPMPRWAGRMLL